MPLGDVAWGPKGVANCNELVKIHLDSAQRDGYVRPCEADNREGWAPCGRAGSSGDVHRPSGWTRTRSRAASSAHRARPQPSTRCHGSARPTGRVRRGMVRYALALADLAGLVTALAGAYFLTSGGTDSRPAADRAARVGGAVGLLRPLPARPRRRRQRDPRRGVADLPLRHRRVVDGVRASSRLSAPSSPPRRPRGRLLGRRHRWRSRPTAASSRSVLRRQLALKQNAVVVGAGLVGQEIARKVLRQPNYGLDLVGFVDPNPLPLHDELADVPVLGSTDELGRDPRDARHRPRRARVHRRPRGRASTSSASATSWASRSTSSRACSRWSEAAPRVYSLEGTPLLGLTPPVLGASHRLAKRTMDVVGRGRSAWSCCRRSSWRPRSRSA